MARNLSVIAILGVLLVVSAACQVGPATSTSPVIYTQPELEYRLLSHFEDFFWCDPDYYPVGRPGQEEKNALEQFVTIRANEAEFSAILGHLTLPDKAEYTDEEKLDIYREHKKLTLAVQIAPSGDIYNFALRVGEGQGESIEGTITPSGKIEVVKREPSINSCPICLAKGTIIETPGGPVPVEDLHAGMAVWTVDNSEARVAAVVVETAATPVPSYFQLVTVSLDDGRVVTASPGHPTAETQPLGSYQVGDRLDGAVVMSVEYEGCDTCMTYDLLPAGVTGLYWANGIMLKSTLK